MLFDTGKTFTKTELINVIHKNSFKNAIVNPLTDGSERKAALEKISNLANSKTIAIIFIQS